MASTAGEKLIAENRRARHDYHFLERVEAGLALKGSEVKSLREGHAVLQRAYADVRDGEIWLMGLHIPPYEQASIEPHDPDRDRKLLLHRREIDQLGSKVAERGLTLVPTRLYFKNGRVKVELALARGKEGRDKRRDIAERETKRRIEREGVALRPSRISSNSSSSPSSSSQWRPTSTNPSRRTIARDGSFSGPTEATKRRIPCASAAAISARTASVAYPRCRCSGKIV
jgi:SsrA-binding protein